MPTFDPEVWATVSVVVLLLFGGLLGRVWTPMRKTIAAVDVIAGRPPRYQGDPEQRPGLAERLDTLDRSIAALKSEVDHVKTEISRLEMGCDED